MRSVFSYNIHMPMEQEEYLADWISLYGADLVYLLDELLPNIDVARAVKNDKMDVRGLKVI